MEEEVEGRGKIGGPGDQLIVDVVLMADALGGGVMGGSDETRAGRALFESLELLEDGSSAVVEQQDAQVARELLVPECVLIVEEAEVANKAKYCFF